jgi:hypothetical protein
MFQRITLCVLLLSLTSCASFKQGFCNCQHEAPPVVQAAPKAEKPSKPVKLVKKKKTKTTESIIVDADDIEQSNKMTKAVDAFVFKDEEDEFKALCAEKRFDCWVNEKRYPTGKAKIDRTVPPFLTGAKMGLRGEERVHVRFNFYP